MQEIMCLMDRFTSSSEAVMQENQGAQFVYDLTSKGGKDQDAMKNIPEDQDKNRRSYSKTPYLNRGDNYV
jgi:hypothetical protein